MDACDDRCRSLSGMGCHSRWDRLLDRRIRPLRVERSHPYVGVRILA